MCTVRVSLPRRIIQAQMQKCIYVLALLFLGTFLCFTCSNKAFCATQDFKKHSNVEEPWNVEMIYLQIWTRNDGIGRPSVSTSGRFFF